MISALGTIEIYKPTYYTREVNGVMQIVRSRYQNTDDGTYNFPVTDACERSATVMAEDYVKLSFKLLHRVVFDAFAYIWYDEQLYFLKEDYRPTSKGSHYEYTMKFVSVANMLDKSLCMRYINVPGQTIDPEPEINMNGTLYDMAAIVMGAINGAAVRLAATRPVGALPLFYVYILQNLTLGTDTKQNTPLKTFSFSGQNISDVLTTLANDYEIEWWVSHESIYASTLHLCRCEVGDTIPVSDEYKSTDESRGLKQPAEYSQEWSNVPQVLIPFGSDRNMNRKQALEDVNGNSMYVSYGKQLRLAPNTDYTVQDREGVSHTVRTNALGAFVSAAVKSGIETTKQFDDIYPRCHFRVMHVQKEGTEHPIYTITAAALKADGTAMSYAEMVAAELLPLQIEPNETLSVVFESGYLNGREFEVRHDIKEVNNVMVWTLTIVPEEGGDDGVSLPFGNFIPHGSDEPNFDGDTFAIFHMVMPAGYVTQAQAELAQAAYDEMLAIEDTRPEIKCKTEQNYFANRRIRLGQRVAVYSELFGELTYDNSDFGISSQSAGLFVSRVTSFQHSLTKPRDIEFKLASACVEGRMASIEAVIADRTSDIRGLEQRSLNLSRRGWHDADEMEKMLQTVLAQMMLVGTAKNQFSFTMAIESVGNNVVSDVEHFGRLHVSAGYIQHTQEPYIKYSNGGKWEVDAADITTDINNNSILYDPAHTEASETPYYLYAHCVNNATKAQLYLTTEGKESEAGDNGDYLLLGILSSEFMDEVAKPKTSLRVFNRSNGYTQIAGGTITTEQIQDPTRSLIIDFQSNPPRIIAKRGAEIIGNIRFKASDEMTAEQQLSALGIGVGEAKDAAEEANEAAAAAQAEAKQAGEAAKEYADGLTKALGDSLQNQIDGVIDSYFMEGVPYGNFRPSSDWGTTEVKNRHLGDTYTNILKNKGNLAELDSNGSPMWLEQGLLSVGSSHYGKTFEEQRVAASNYCRTKTIFENYNGLKIGAMPDGIQKLVILYDANKQYVNNLGWTSDAVTLTNPSAYPYISIIFKKTDGTAITPSDLDGITSSELTNPEAGKSWRWCNNDDTYDSTFHWHEIADSDAVLALQKAAEAQDTADEKRRVFVSQPTPPYEVGDLWAQGSGSGEDILKCTTARATGSFQQSDWAAASSALSAAADAKQAADNAKTAANNAQNAVNNVTDDGIISGGTEKANLKREWQAIAGANMLGNTDGSYFKALSQANKYSVIATSMQNYFAALKNAMDYILEKQDEDTTISSGIPTSASSSIKTRDDFNLLWKNYYDAEIAVLNAVSDKIKSAADAAQATADGLKWSVIKNYGDADIEYLRAMLVKGFNHKIYEVLPAGTYRATLLSENPGVVSSNDGFSSSSLMIVKSGQSTSTESNIIKIVNWDEEFTITENVDIHVLLCQKNYYSSTKRFPYSGTWNLKGIRVLTLTTQSVSALDYLRAALTDGSTEIAGGLTMTNVLMLKNLQGAVTAGMSGLTKLPSDSSKSENVLMWGGGTYEDAYNAAESADYYKKDSATPITTLLKKDGTGKIGIFKISDTQAIIDVTNQGKVVIDASSSNGGIFVKDTNGLDKAILTPKSLSTVSVNNKKTLSKSNKDSNLSVSVKKYTYSRTIFTINSDKGTHSPKCSIVVNTRITVSPGQLSQSEINTLSFYIILFLTNSSGKTEYRNIYSTSKKITYEENNEAYDNQDNLIYDFKYSGSVELSTLSNCVLNYVQLGVEVHGNYDGDTEDQPECRIENVLLNNSISITDDITLSVNPHTIIANDGILSYYDSTKYFKVQNTSSGQKIYAKGLSTTKGTSGSGELYVSKDFIDAFKALCDELNAFFPSVRTVGNNSTNADKCIEKVTNVKNKIDATSIIANS